MLEKLYIKNYLLIKEAELQFNKGLNILTGETGAGKSILIDSIMLMLGERADYSLIRKGEDKLIIEGWFNIAKYPQIKKTFEERLPENKDYLIFRRELTNKSISRAFINDSPVNISELKAAGDLLVDIHSQNEHQSLLKKENHLPVIDLYIDKDSLLTNYKQAYKETLQALKSLNSLKSTQKEINEKQSFIEFQLKEINNLNPQENEEEELISELKLLENYENISSAIQQALYLIEDENSSVLPQLNAAIKELAKIEGYIDAHEQTKELQSAYSTLKQVSADLRAISGNSEYNPARIEELRHRLAAITFLKKKYTLTFEELIHKQQHLQDELRKAENLDNEIEKAEKFYDESKEKLYKAGIELSKERESASAKLKKQVNNFFKQIGLESALFEISLSKKSEHSENEINHKGTVFNASGIDDAEFLISAYKGADFSSIHKTASGGEISRIMLAIKSAIAGKDNIPLLIFDEVDTGISGRIAGKAGELLQKLSGTHQLICITHLPQIASLKGKHFSIRKIESKGKTITVIDDLSDEERINEIAKLISGKGVTDSAINSAKELLEVIE